MLKHVKKATTAAILASTLTIGAGAYAMTSSTTSSNSTVQPYTGGASISRVFYPGDGSTVTITSTGAVIKQSPGHTAYREGWVSVCDMNNINSEADLRGRIASGSSNPYSSHCQTTSNTSSPAPTPTASANATANATVNLTGSSITPATQTTTSTSTPSNTSASSSGKSLPNTGPGSVFAISGIVAVLSAVGHFAFQRLRFRTLA